MPVERVRQRFQLRTITLALNDGGQAVFQLGKYDTADLTIQRDIVSFDGGAGWLEHKALSSGEVKMSFTFEKMSYAPRPAKPKPRKKR